MPVQIPTIASGATVTPATINDVFRKIQEFLNGGIENTDIVSSGSTLISTREMTKPEFYGAPAPRVEMICGAVHFRKQDPGKHFFVDNEMTTSFVPIPQMSATFFVDPQSSNQSCQAILTATFNSSEFFRGISSTYTAKRGGTNTDNELKVGVHEETEAKAAEFAAFVNGREVVGTRRFICSRFSNEKNLMTDFTFKQISISCIITLELGANDVSIRVKPKPNLDVTFREGSSSSAYGLLGHIIVSGGSIYCETLIK